MLRSRAFTKITKKGAIVKVVKEHYLRDDIPCGLAACTFCYQSEEGKGQASSISNAIIKLDPLAPECIRNSAITAQPASEVSPFVLIPDTNVFLHLMDLIENAKPNALLSNIVLLQTVLDEVQSRNPQLHARVRALIGKPERRFFVFSNEHHRECFAGDSASNDESDNDRNDRAIRLAAAWYQKHLDAVYPSSQRVRSVLLTHDVGNAEHARAQGLIALDMRTFLQGVPTEYTSSVAGLLDIVDAAFSSRPDADSTSDKRALYPEHISEAAMRTGIEAGKLFKGTLQASPYNPFVGSITCDQGTIHVPTKLAMNRAIHSDVVVIELLPKSEWIHTEAHEASSADDEKKEPSSEDPLAINLDTPGDLLQFPPLEALPATTEAPSDARPCGRVVGILRRSTRAHVGSIDRSAVRPDAPIQTLLFFPLDRRIPRIRIRTRQAAQLAGQRIVVAFDGWDCTDSFPRGHFVRDLGPAGDRVTEVSAILLAHDVNDSAFTPAVLSELPREGTAWKPSAEDYATRTDFRSLDVCSIDPPGCTDIDDALHALILPNGNVQVGVHIADVTHFVPADGAMDREASSRATTVYLVDRRIDMLPALLGSDLCSLKGDVERLAFSCIWEMRIEDSSIVSTHFSRSIIKSRAAFTYDQAQERLDLPGEWNDYASDGTAPVERRLIGSVKLLAHLAHKLKAQRIAAGALTLASPEVRFSLDTSTANPVDVELKEMREANSLVEEFMLLANVSVATRLVEHFPQTALLRRHPAPPTENFDSLNKALAPHGFSLDPTDSRHLQTSLDLAVKPEDTYFNRLVRIMATRCMYQAQYFPAGTLAPEQYWHYGLACALYTHFTSPIRRYADVLVHRLLAVAINAPGARSLGIASTVQRLTDVCDNLNYRNRMAQQAQRASIDLFTALFFRNRTVTEPAYVIRVMKNALVALVPKYGMECVVPLGESVADGSLRYDAERSCFFGPAEGTPALLQLFQLVHIQISVEELEVSLRQRLVVKLVDSAPEPSNSPSPSKRRLEEP